MKLEHRQAATSEIKLETQKINIKHIFLFVSFFTFNWRLKCRLKAEQNGFCIDFVAFSASPQTSFLLTEN